MNEIIISILSLAIFISVMSIRIGRKHKGLPKYDNPPKPPLSKQQQLNKSDIMNRVQDMQEKAWENNKGHNEYELEVRELVSNYIIAYFKQK